MGSSPNAPLAGLTCPPPLARSPSQFASALLVAAIRQTSRQRDLGISLRVARYLDMPGKSKRMHSIKNKKTYEALMRKGMSKTRAAKISNAQRSKSR